MSGSGKTTLGKIVSEILKMEFVDFADLISAKAHLLGHDDILRISPKILVDVVEEAREDLAKTVTDGKRFILESHLGVFVAEIGYRLTNPDILKKRNTLSIIAVIPKYNDLLSYKRARDAERDKIVLSKETYEMNREMLLVDASINAAMLKIPLFIEENPINNLRANAERLAQVIKTANLIQGY